MPRGDGTGPMGAGAMTGRGGGYCTGAGAQGLANVPGARGRGFFGGRRGGLGRVMCAGGWGPRAVSPGGGQAGPAGAAEKDLLQSQAKALQAELDLIKSRLAQLESERKEQ